jgi:hypothetical protein
MAPGIIDALAKEMIYVAVRYAFGESSRFIVLARKPIDCSMFDDNSTVDLKKLSKNLSVHILPKLPSVSSLYCLLL